MYTDILITIFLYFICGFQLVQCTRQSKLTLSDYRVLPWAITFWPIFIVWNMIYFLVNGINNDS